MYKYAKTLSEDGISLVTTALCGHWKKTQPQRHRTTARTLQRRSTEGFSG
ncbi:hypothetical protein [Leyella lascolaii]|uniref:Uncharacterized protein n=1 Tax=Leyella lascolaii TaxID=1776379 RepID=A0AAW7JED4_9BACT|nr:hypothetical protein [Leyella lascolaii]MDN0021777.1 hypothetical protein [Leyella lascolaii]MDN0024274.1 hypothetical protein [Leyella lascolaii]